MTNAKVLQASMLQYLSNYLGGSIWCLFAFPTKSLNIHNSRTSAIPKVGMHLGVIGLHPLHSPPFVKMCFTTKHTLGLMGPCTSHFIINPMLGLQHEGSQVPHHRPILGGNQGVGTLTCSYCQQVGHLFNCYLFVDDRLR
jgi:hypothetical protein